MNVIRLRAQPVGGHDLEQPTPMNRREQVRSTGHPSTDRWITLTTEWADHTVVYRVTVVDGFNCPYLQPQDFRTPTRARNEANRLYNRYIQTEQENH